MARSEATDYLQSFRFHVSGELAPSGSGVDPLRFSDADTLVDQQQAGFMNCSLPEISQDVVEYREGTFLYTRKFLGPPTFSDVSLQRGITRRDSAFHDWAFRAITGGEYRADINIRHFHRDILANLQNFANGDSGESTRTYVCHECVPIRAKPGADLDANTGDVSLAELDFALEWFEIANGVE